MINVEKSGCSEPPRSRVNDGCVSLARFPSSLGAVRSKLLPLVHPDDDCLHGIKESALLNEFSHTMNAVFTDPNDQVNFVGSCTRPRSYVSHLFFMIDFVRLDKRGETVK